MEAAVTIGLDQGKLVFQVHGVDRENVVQRRLNGARLIAFFAKQPAWRPAQLEGAAELARAQVRLFGELSHMERLVEIALRIGEGALDPVGFGLQIQQCRELRLAYGTSAELKNAIDWVYPEWHRKEAGFVSYGSTMGTRSMQQLRETAIELQLAPIRSSVRIPVATLWAHYQGGDVEAGLADLAVPAGTFIDDLLWWTAALKTARAGRS